MYSDFLGFFHFLLLAFRRHKMTQTAQNLYKACFMMMCCLDWQQTQDKFGLVADRWILYYLVCFIFVINNLAEFIVVVFIEHHFAYFIMFQMRKSFNIVSQWPMGEHLIFSFQVFNILILKLGVVGETLCHKYIFYIWMFNCFLNIADWRRGCSLFFCFVFDIFVAIFNF